MATVMRQFLDNSYLYGANASFIEELYEKYLVNPQSVPEEWREYFDRIQVLPGNAAKDVAHAPVVESFVQRAKAGQLGGQARTLPAEPVTPERLQVAALLLVTAYRIAGSRWATVDPLKRMPRPGIPELEPGFYDLSEADLDQTVNAGSFVGLDRTALRKLLQVLRDTYCRNIGFEYMFLSERAQRQWIQERIEPVRATPEFPPEQKKRLLQKLTEAEQLERYLHTRYVGQKRFSLEGGESLIPSIDELIQRAGGNGVQEMVIGMAHRGRLNVLVNVLGKMPKDLFLEFEGKQASELPSGDVKYHNGFSSDISTSGGPVHISLAFNPSHLEIVEMSEENPLWYFTSPEGSSEACLPSNSRNRSFGILPSTLTSTLSRPRCAMPITISCTPLPPARWISSSINGIRLSPPSSEKRFWPT